jgi:hypothetical protein
MGSASLPKTMRESVPKVNEAFRPTASVSGTLVCSCVGSDECGGCEGVVVSRRGSLKGSSEPAIEAMVIVASQRGRTACCTKRVTGINVESTSSLDSW